MNALVIGYGSIGKRHCRLLLSMGVETHNIFVADLQKTRVGEAQEAGYKIFNIGADTSKQFDIVVVASSTSSHIEVLKLIPKVSKLLYIEKPLAHNYLKVAPLARSLKRHIGNAKIVVGYMLRQHPAVQYIKKCIEENKFGKVLKYRSECGMYLPNWHPWEDYRDFYMSDIDGGGGALLDISHEIDLSCYLIGKSNRAFGILGNLSDLECSSDDFSEIMLQHKNGAIGSISLDLIQKNTFRKTRIVLDKAEVEIDFIGKKLSINTGINEVMNEAFKIDGDDLYIRQYEDALSDKGKISCSLDEALDVMQIIHAVRKSSETGAFINLPIYSGLDA